MTAKQIKALRTALGLTQVAFADRIGVAWNTVARWERDEVHPKGLSVKALKALALETRSVGRT